MRQAFYCNNHNQQYQARYCCRIPLSTQGPYVTKPRTSTIFFAPADPCVRVFAELALKEIRLGESDAGLLSDKGAFSEFMDKINERYGVGHLDITNVHLSSLLCIFPYGRSAIGAEGAALKPYR